MSNNFTHLHVHSQYSLLDGANKFDELIPYTKKLGMNSIACTDHGWCAGLVDFYKACKKGGIKPLLGCEIYATEDEDDKEKDKTRDNMHMILIAKDLKGYQLLCEAVSTAALHNFYYKPRVWEKNLEKMGGHVICTTSCLGGVGAKRAHFELDAYERARVCLDEERRVRSALERYASIFNGDFFVEIQDWPDENKYQQTYNEFILKEGRTLGLPFVITADAHYLTKDDTRLHDLLMAMQLGKTLDTYHENDEMKYGPHFYVKSPEEMLTSAKNWKCEEAYYNTGKIAALCNVELELGKYKQPMFDITQEEDYSEFKQWLKGKNNILECTHHAHT